MQLFSFICCLWFVVCFAFISVAQSRMSKITVMHTAFRNTRWSTALDILYPALCAVRLEYPVERLLSTWIPLLALAHKPVWCVNFVLLVATFRSVLRSFSSLIFSVYSCWSQLTVLVHQAFFLLMRDCHALELVFRFLIIEHYTFSLLVQPNSK